MTKANVSMANINMKQLVDLYEQALRSKDVSALSTAKGALEHAAAAEASIIHMNAAEAMAQVHLRVLGKRD